MFCLGPFIRDTVAEGCLTELLLTYFFEEIVLKKLHTNMLCMYTWSIFKWSQLFLFAFCQQMHSESCCNLVEITFKDMNIFGKLLASLLPVLGNVAPQIAHCLERQKMLSSICKRSVISGIPYCIDPKNFSRTLAYKSLEILLPWCSFCCER